MKHLNPQYMVACLAIFFSFFIIKAKTQTISTYINPTVNTKGVAFDATTGNVYLISGYKNILKVSPTGVISNFANFASVVLASIVIYKNGNLFVSDQNQNTIFKITSSGVISTYLNTGLSTPSSMAFDKSGNLFISNGDNTIKEVTAVGAISNYATGFNNPQGIAFDTTGNLYVVNAGDNTIRKVTKMELFLHLLINT